jgi:hypothetical protein
MKDFKGTKGEWQVTQTIKECFSYVRCGTKRIAEVKHYKGLYQFIDPDDLEGIANANLISAAPELLELALLVNGSFGGGLVMTFNEDDCNKFQQVINKALGNE